MPDILRRFAVRVCLTHLAADSVCASLSVHEISSTETRALPPLIHCVHLDELENLLTRLGAIPSVIRQVIFNCERQKRTDFNCVFDPEALLREGFAIA